jgi:hypothetical protein
MRTKPSKHDEPKKVSAIAVPSENDTHYAVVHLPRTFIGKRCWVMTQEYYDSIRQAKTKK